MNQITPNDNSKLAGKPSEAFIALSPFGFRWGRCEVVRMAEVSGNLVVWVQTDKEKLEVRITPAGKVIAGSSVPNPSGYSVKEADLFTTKFPGHD